MKAASVTPAFVHPQCPINDKRMYPVYAKCVELDIPVLCTTGVPGPRVPMAAQDVALIDEVCWFFPELKFVMRHGGEPWTWLTAKLLLKWPNLYYSTSAFAPNHYPDDIIQFANTRGADKVLYAGYFPAGLSLDRIFRDMPYVPFREHVWPKFLRENGGVASSASTSSERGGARRPSTTGPVVAYRPWNCGSRRSRKELTPSAPSSVAPSWRL